MSLFQNRDKGFYRSPLRLQMMTWTCIASQRRKYLQPELPSPPDCMLRPRLGRLIIKSAASLPCEEVASNWSSSRYQPPVATKLPVIRVLSPAFATQVCCLRPCCSAEQGTRARQKRDFRPTILEDYSRLCELPSVG
nr:hypothetical protein CFP56_69073 [Quercus suber]